MHGVNDEFRFAELARLARHDDADGGSRELLHPVANAEDRFPGFEQLRRHVRRTRGDNAFGTARQNERRWVAALYLFPRRVVGQNLGVDVFFADAPGD